MAKILAVNYRSHYPLRPLYTRTFCLVKLLWVIHAFFKVHQFILVASTLFLSKTISCDFALSSNLLASYRPSLHQRLLPWSPSPVFL